MSGGLSLANPQELESRRPLDFISFSQISTYQQCPLRYFFRYVQRLPEPFVSSSLVFGAAIHRAVEFHYRQIMTGAQPPDNGSLLGEFWAEWEARRTAEIKFAREETIDSLGRLAERMLTAFQGSGAASPGGTIIGIEEELRGEVIAGCPQLLGKVDLIVDRGDELVVIDFKTAKSRWSQAQADDAADQLPRQQSDPTRIPPEPSIRPQENR